MDDGKLVIQALLYFLGDFRIAGRQCLFTEGPQVGFVILIGFGNGIIRQLDMAKLKVHLTTLGNLYRIAQGFGMVREQSGHFFWGFQIVIIAVEAHAVRVIHGLAHLNAEQNIVEFTVLAAYIMAVVGGHKAQAVLFRQFDKSCISCAFLWQTVILNFQKVIVLAEDIDVFLYQPFGFILVVLDKGLRHIARDTGGQADNALVILAQQLHIHPGLVVHALDIGQRHELDEVLIARLIFCQQNQMVVADAVDILPFLTGSGC